MIECISVMNTPVSIRYHEPDISTCSNSLVCNIPFFIGDPIYRATFKHHLNFNTPFYRRYYVIHQIEVVKLVKIEANRFTGVVDCTCDRCKAAVRGGKYRHIPFETECLIREVRLPDTVYSKIVPVFCRIRIPIFTSGFISVPLQDHPLPHILHRRTYPPIYSIRDAINHNIHDIAFFILQDYFISDIR